MIPLLHRHISVLVRVREDFTRALPFSWRFVVDLASGALSMLGKDVEVEGDYNEAISLYLLALGFSTFPISANTWAA